MKNITVKQAIAVLEKEMVDVTPGSYATGWHDNIAMMCMDAIVSIDNTTTDTVAHQMGNEAAVRFMKLCFGSDTSQHAKYVTTRSGSKQ